MRNSKMKKLTSLLLIGCIILSCLCISITAADSGNYGLYRWTNVRSLQGSITFNRTSGNYTMSVIGDSGVTKITATAILYYKNSSGKWIVVPKNWTYSVDDEELYINEDFTGVSGREYKIELSGTVYKYGYGKAISETTTKTCP